LEVLFRARAEDRKRAAREIKEIKASAEAQVCNALHASAAHCFRYHHLSTIQSISINVFIAAVRYCVGHALNPVCPSSLLSSRASRSYLATLKGRKQKATFELLQ
jgi:hypothetical protein